MDPWIVAVLCMIFAVVMAVFAMTKEFAYDLAAWWRCDEEKDRTLRYALLRASGPAAWAVIRYLEEKALLAVMEKENGREVSPLLLDTRLRVSDLQSLVRDALLRAILDEWKGVEPDAPPLDREPGR